MQQHKNEKCCWAWYQSQDIERGKQPSPSPLPNTHHSSTIQPVINVPTPTTTPSLQPTPTVNPWPQPLPAGKPPPPNIPKPEQEKMRWHDFTAITRGRNSKALMPAWKGSTGLCGAPDDQLTTPSVQDSGPQVIDKGKHPPPQPQPSTQHSTLIEPKISISRPELQQPPPRHNLLPQPPPPRSPPPPNIPEPKQVQPTTPALQDSQPQVSEKGKRSPPQPQPSTHHSTLIQPKISMPPPQSQQQPPRHNLWPQPPPPRRPPPPSIPEPEQVQMWAEKGYQDKSSAQHSKYLSWNAGGVDDDLDTRSQYFHLDTQRKDGNNCKREEPYYDMDSTTSHVLKLVIRRPRDLVFIAFLKRTQERQTLGVTVRETPDEGLEIDTDTCYTDARWTQKTMVGEWNRLTTESNQLYKRIEKNDMIFSVNKNIRVDKQGLAEMVNELKTGQELRLVLRRSINKS